VTLLDQSNPEALNFNEEQSFKLFGTAGTNALMYTSAQSVSLGGTAFEPQEEDDIDSQESTIFDHSDTSRADKNIEDDTEGAFIVNMGAAGLGLASAPPPMDSQEDSADDMEGKRMEPGPSDQVYSPAKVTRMASIRLGFSTETSGSHRKDIEEMIQQWIDENRNHAIPAHLVDLAARAQVKMSIFTPSATTPRRRDKQGKGNLSTPTTAEGAREGILIGRRFVLTGVWPYQGSGQGLTLGKERVKQRIEH
jgi:hypothetical protein